jgi:hypothetical protein
MTRRLDYRGNWLLGSSLLLLTVACAGCGRGTGTVSGTVKFNEKPLPGGTIVFHPHDGSAVRGAIETDGSFSVADVPAGPVKIAVVTLAAPRNLGNPDGFVFKDAKASDKDRSGVAKQYVTIPERYRDPEKSGLEYTVKTGSQTKDIDLVSSVDLRK